MTYIVVVLCRQRPTKIFSELTLAVIKRTEQSKNKILNLPRIRLFLSTHLKHKIRESHILHRKPRTVSRYRYNQHLKCHSTKKQPFPSQNRRKFLVTTKKTRVKLISLTTENRSFINTVRYTKIKCKLFAAHLHVQ